MTDPRRPLGRHELTEDEKRLIREEAEARYRAEVEADLAARQPVADAVPLDAPGNPAGPAVAAPKPETRTERWAREEQERRAKMTPKQLKEHELGGKILTWVVALSVAGLGIWGFQSCGAAVRSSGERRAAEAARAATLAGQTPGLIREYCLDSVRNKLKAPSTARFNDDGRPVFTNGAWMWVSHVDAQNSFGAQIRTMFTCEVTGTSMDDARIATSLL